METTNRPQRADARRNRNKIVAAARTAFAEYGLEAQMDDIAQRAGVGVGTLYRHFPTKDALVRGIVVSHMERMAERGRQVVAEDGEPWDAFAGFLRFCGEQHLADRGLAQVVSYQPASTFTDAARESGLVAAVEELLARAQAAGDARADAGVGDVPLTMCALGAVRQSFGEEGARRFMELVLDGLKRGDCAALPDFTI